MSDKNGTTTTTPHQVLDRLWEDPNSGLRRHKLMTKELGETIPALYANERRRRLRLRPRARQAVLPYTPAGAGTSPSGTPKPETCFGLVEGFETELGYFELTELAETTVFGGVPAVERDLYWKPTTLGDIRGRLSGIAA